MQIQIEGNNWGDAAVGNIQCLLQDIFGQLTRHFSQIPDGRIRVFCRPEETSPRVLYRAAETDEYIVWLTTRNRLWAQYSYQFSHELCHILSNFEKLRLIPNQWFQESMCELASIFTIKQMATTWLKNPPYPNWRDYATSLNDYVEELITNQDSRLPGDMSLGCWVQANEAALRDNPYQRRMNALVAIQLLPLFQATPNHWQVVRYMPNTNDPFTKFLFQWRIACPEEHKKFISDIAGLFGINLANEAN